MDFFFSINTCTVSICSWESTNTESQLYALIYAILYRRLEHSRILVICRGAGANSPWIPRGNLSLGTVENLYIISSAQGLGTPTFVLFKGQLYYFMVERCQFDYYKKSAKHKRFKK